MDMHIHMDGYKKKISTARAREKRRANSHTINKQSRGNRCLTGKAVALQRRVYKVPPSTILGKYKERTSLHWEPRGLRELLAEERR